MTTDNHSLELFPDFSTDTVLARKVEAIDNILWKNHFRPETHLIYDYCSSRDFDHRHDHLPSPKEIAAHQPSPCSWQSGMEDCMINAGIQLSTLVDRYAVTHDEALKKSAGELFSGMVTCATIHGVKGFVVRGVCLADGKSYYPESSRDQFTHFVHGLWRLYHSPLADETQKNKIRTMLADVGSFMARHITEKNQYSFPRLDRLAATPFADHSWNPWLGKMWAVLPHEAARLPMIYAAAWDVTGDHEFFQLYEKYVEPALQQSLELHRTPYPAFTMMQMQCSLEIILAVEPHEELRTLCRNAMIRAAEYSEVCTWDFCRPESTPDFTALPQDWRLKTHEVYDEYAIPDLGSFELVRQRIRAVAEAPLVQLMTPDRPMENTQLGLLKHAIMTLDPALCTSVVIATLMAPYWRRRHNESADADGDRKKVLGGDVRPARL